METRPDEHIAYDGSAFTIEWYFDRSGFSQARDYAESLTEADKRKLAVLLGVFGNIGKVRNKQKFRYEGDGIYAFKPKPHRFLSFFFEGQKVIITNAFTKKRDKVPPGEKDRALRCRKDYELRVKQGSYYGQD